MRKAIFKIFLISIFPFTFCVFFDCSIIPILQADFVLSNSINIFAVSLAITAIFFTVIDRYKSKQTDVSAIEQLCLPIIKEMCENVLGILVIIGIMFIVSVMEPLLSTIAIPKFMRNFSICNFVIFDGFLLVLAILFDIAKSVLSLTQGLFISTSSQNTKDSNKNYEAFKDFCKKLDPKHFHELCEYAKTVYIKQQLENNQNKKE